MQSLDSPTDKVRNPIWNQTLFFTHETTTIKVTKKKLSNPSVIEPQTQNNENNRKGRSEAPNPKRAEEKDRRMNEIKRDPTPLPGVSRSQGALRRNYSLEDSPYSR